MYNGVLKDGAPADAKDFKEEKNIYAYLITNGLITQKKRKRGDPVEEITVKREFLSRTKGQSVDNVPKPKPISKLKEIR